MASLNAASTRIVCRATALVLVALFLAAVARFYHRDYGFTALIGFPYDHGYELPALQAVPHAGTSQYGYDGQFYSQLALEPLLRDPAIDRALDLAPYRARRILFSWTAYALGLGRPAWILEAFALQNVGCWLLLAVLLTRWFPLDSTRHLALWAATLFTHGVLISVRYALVDGPSLLLVSVALLLAERGRQWGAAAVIGAAALGRETNLFGAAGVLERPTRLGGWLRLVLAGAFMLLPLLLWQDYLRSIYRSATLAEQNNFVAPFLTFFAQWASALRAARLSGFTSPTVLGLCALVSLTAQAAYLVRRRAYRSPWWRVAAVYAVLMFTVHEVVWTGSPGAITRVMLPMTLGVNVLLASERGAAFWGWLLAGSLLVVPGLKALPMW